MHIDVVVLCPATLLPRLPPYHLPRMRPPRFYLAPGRHGPGSGGILDVLAPCTPARVSSGAGMGMPLRHDEAPPVVEGWIPDNEVLTVADVSRCLQIGLAVAVKLP